MTLALTALLVAAITLPPLPAGGEEGDDEFVLGSAEADARVVQVGPTAGQLSLAPTIGVALADYSGTVGRGESLVFDWVALEDSVPEDFRAEFDSVRVDSREEGAAEGKRETRAGSPDDSPIRGALFERFARADDTPVGQSSFRTGSLEIPGVIEVSEGIARSSASIIAGEVREARAVSEIARISVGDGEVVLEGLRWEALHRTGAEEVTRATFSLGGLEVAGERVPLPEDLDGLRSVFEEVNGLLEPTGLELVLPSADTRGGVARMRPLAIRIVESPLGQEHVGPVLGELQPVREPVFEALIDFFKQLHEDSDEEIPDFTSLVLVTDIVLGVASGSSSLHFNLGGTMAFSEGQRFENPFGEFTPPEVEPRAAVETEVIPGTEGTPPTSPAEPEPDDDTDSEESFAAVPQRTGPEPIPGVRGGAALIVGAAGVLAALAMAGVDLHRMRRASTAVDG